MRSGIALLGIGAALIVPLALADDSWELPLDEPQLKPGPKVEVVATNCQMCHSADYITTQPPMTRAAWTATVLKMREKYGAPLQTNLVEEIVNYIAGAYGKK